MNPVVIGTLKVLLVVLILAWIFYAADPEGL